MNQQYSYLRIRQLRHKGHTWQQIREAIGCSKYTVWRALHDDIDGIRKKERERGCIPNQKPPIMVVEGYYK